MSSVNKMLEEFMKRQNKAVELYLGTNVVALYRDAQIQNIGSDEEAAKRRWDYIKSNIEDATDIIGVPREVNAVCELIFNKNPYTDTTTICGGCEFGQTHGKCYKPDSFADSIAKLVQKKMEQVEASDDSSIPLTNEWYKKTLSEIEAEYKLETHREPIPNKPKPPLDINGASFTVKLRERYDERGAGVSFTIKNIDGTARLTQLEGDQELVYRLALNEVADPDVWSILATLAHTVDNKETDICIDSITVTPNLTSLPTEAPITYNEALCKLMEYKAQAIAWFLGSAEVASCYFTDKDREAIMKWFESRAKDVFTSIKEFLLNVRDINGLRSRVSDLSGLPAEMCPFCVETNNSCGNCDYRRRHGVCSNSLSVFSSISAKVNDVRTGKRLGRYDVNAPLSYCWYLSVVLHLAQLVEPVAEPKKKLVDFMKQLSLSCVELAGINNKELQQALSHLLFNKEDERDIMTWDDRKATKIFIEVQRNAKDIIEADLSGTRVKLVPTVFCWENKLEDLYTDTSLISCHDCSFAQRHGCCHDADSDNRTLASLLPNDVTLSDVFRKAFNTK